MLDLADTLARQTAIEVLEAPTPASVMIELQSPVGDFYFTEVVVTAALVSLAGREGWGCVMGWDEEAALAAALLDAAPTAAVRQLAALALEVEASARTSAAVAAAATRVPAT